MKTSPETAEATVAPSAAVPAEHRAAGTIDAVRRQPVCLDRPPVEACLKPPRVGWAWRLPRDAGSARHARSLLAEALTLLGAPRDLIADAQLMVSELATNAHQHASEYGPHELWLYLPGAAEPGPADPGQAEPEQPAPAPGPAEPVAAEVRCAIFDGKANTHLPGYSWTSGDYGRGLNIVNELSSGRWGLRHASSHLDPPTTGKAVWFAIPLPRGKARQILQHHPPASR